VLFSMFYVPAVSKMHYLVVLVLQVQYMTDFFRSGERLVYSNVCGLMVYRYMITRLGLTGNGRLWMALLQRHLLGEKGTGPNPTDRAKSGTKRSLLVDGKGVPLSVSVDGANRHDMKLTKSTLQNVVINKPEPTIKSKQHMYVWIKAMTIQKYMNYWKSMVIQFISD
jgi:hypothetical protein